MDDENLICINDEVAIPLAELNFRFTTSSGPGGQHANRSATRAVLMFDVAQSPNLAEEVRARLLMKLATRLDKEGVLQIQVQDSRSQVQNRELAIIRFRELLAEALKVRKRRRKTKPSKAAQEARLAAKKRQGERKQDRSWR
ncbi:MAG: aminoacyl-tRNA hydrolase, partial [Anaerolineales bacterium]|nr:aminoacyl-tRNA hydrolase [Anaerolineales bacterium]